MKPKKQERKAKEKLDRIGRDVDWLFNKSGKSEAEVRASIQETLDNAMVPLVPVAPN